MCIYLLKGHFNFHNKIKQIGEENCVLSEITIAELKFGAENSIQKEKNRKSVDLIQNKFTILPIFPALDIYAIEKSRLKTKGNILDDFDLLIGSTAIINNLTLVTKNVSDFKRLDGILIEDWTVI
ncbi:MAG: PIN domain-containing protein [Chitinophagales bacterium]|nr:PIN domain-containing protein [Bacteroidota bacterium]MCB9074021.1 PIN domain-containing protein [Chitinophagales bacterium]